MALAARSAVFAVDQCDMQSETTGGSPFVSEIATCHGRVTVLKYLTITLAACHVGRCIMSGE